MMRPGLSLFARILLWYFLSLLLIGAILFGIFNLQFRMGPISPLQGLMADRLEKVAGLIAREVGRAPRENWDEILAEYSDTYEVEFRLLSGSGRQLAGPEGALPAELQQRLRAERRRPKPSQGTGPQIGDGNPERRESGRSQSPGRRKGTPLHRFHMRSSDPVLYWGGIQMPMQGGDGRGPRSITLLASSASMSGNGLFFDVRPWLIVAGVILLLSILLWLPLVRSITLPLGKVTQATERIAQGHFDVRLAARRSDEIGRLGTAINDMAARLSRFVSGQKRFLGDIAHELASPLARIQLGLGILEQKGGDDSGELAGVREEVEHMADLVNELLSFSRADIRPDRVELGEVELGAVVARVLARETGDGDNVTLEMEDGLLAVADADLLARAIANLLRNALRYAADAGAITITTRREGDAALIEVADLGPGVPDTFLSELFEPFSRPDSDRGFETGGSGLGLAIVKTCIDACRGEIEAMNLKPRGFAVRIRLAAL